MIIENPDAFKSWLTSILEPLCDADPAALAKYVYALVKKDRVLEDLREGMLDQLDVFLQHETKPFVDMLFKALETQEYLKLMAVKEEREPSPSPALEPEPQEPSNEIEEVEPAAPAANGTTSEEARPIGNAVSKSPPASGAPRHRVVMSRHAGVKHAAPAPRPPPHAEQTLVKLMPLTELLEEPIDQPPRRRDRRNDAMRDKDDRRRRRSRSWERRVRARRHASPHNDGRRFDNRRLTSRSPSPRGRYRNRSPPPVAGERPLSRSRSRSPIPLRERPHDRERERIRPPRELERERMSRDREHRERVSRSRDRDRSRDRSRERSRGSAGTPTQEMCDRAAAYKRRCRDFDEKGYCMRGDLCQWDHGTDPLVLEDAALSRVLHMPPPVPEYNPLSPDIWGGAAMGPGMAPFPPHHMPPARELIPIPRIHDVPPPPLIPPPAPHPPRAHAPMQKRIFDYNRLGGPRSAMGPGGVGNCSLEVKKVPRGMNDITHLNQHFGKFGKIVNIQVCYEGDPEAALITFSNHTEANVAYKSTEAVLNNRFIKVFWHIHESKQENVPPQPSAAAPGNKLGTASHNKVLINKDNMRVTQDNLARKATEEKQAKEAAAQNGEAIKKEIAPAPKPLEKTKQMMEHKRAQTLLETQLQQQVLLINKLESGNVTGPQKAALMDAINSSQEGIEKLRKELVAYNKTLRQVQANAKRPKTREEAQKEILDAELDLFTKQQEGQDITELAKKISELRRQMSLQFPTHARPQRPHSRGARFNPSVHRINRTASAQHANPHQVPHQPKVFVNQSLDHRPRAVLISGFETDELQPLIAHFSQFGEVTGKEVNMAVPELTLQFKVRSMAEQAMARGKNYNERTLSITWVTNNKPITPLASTAAVAQPEPPLPTNGQTHETIAEDVAEQLKQELTEDVLLRFDEEEEDDAEEDRSWRR